MFHGITNRDNQITEKNTFQSNVRVPDKQFTEEKFRNPLKYNL